MQGIYVLIIRLSRETDVAVGRLGNLHFPKSLYAYVGSAQTALEKRVERHLKREKRMFWHIDYLLQNPASKIVRIFYEPASRAEECKLAKQIEAKGEAVASFGSSDCRCKSHLFRIENYEFLQEFMKEYTTTNPSASS